jgi:DNA primase
MATKCQHLVALTEDVSKRINDIKAWAKNERQPENVEMAKMTVLEELAKLASQRGLAAELKEVSDSAKDGLDETDIWRLGRAADAKNKASLSDTDDKAEYDLADNGARVNRDERSALDNLIGKIGLSGGEK